MKRTFQLWVGRVSWLCVELYKHEYRELRKREVKPQLLSSAIYSHSAPSCLVPLLLLA